MYWIMLFQVLHPGTMHNITFYEVQTIEHCPFIGFVPMVEQRLRADWIVVPHYHIFRVRIEHGELTPREGRSFWQPCHWWILTSEGVYRCRYCQLRNNPLCYWWGDCLVLVDAEVQCWALPASLCHYDEGDAVFVATGYVAHIGLLGR